ncbi:hypothetical protein CFP56_011292 [Quercus suber]|uniref:Uncharacterized protein n=1 Tax=Quercus suber TaxID=58331 RepID=A0AAW0MD29_QUESU
MELKIYFYRESRYRQMMSYKTNHMCCQIGVFSFLYIPIASAFVPMPCFYQCRLEGTPLDLPIANEIYVSIVKLQNFSAQSSIGLSKLWSC